MFKKVLIISCAMSALLLSGCANLLGVSKSDYEAAMADRDMELNNYVEIVDENYELEAEWDALQEEVQLLQDEVFALEEEVEIAREEAAAAEGLGELVIHEITDEVALKFRLPEGYSYVSDGLYTVSSYDPSNILIKSTQTNALGLVFTEEMMEEYLLQTYEEMGYDVENFEMVNFERSEIQGYDVIVMDMALTAQGLNIQQIEVVVQVEDMTCVIVYTTEESFGWYDEFLESVDSIQIGKVK